MPLLPPLNSLAQISTPTTHSLPPSRLPLPLHLAIEPSNDLHIPMFVSMDRRQDANPYCLQNRRESRKIMEVIVKLLPGQDQSHATHYVWGCVNNGAEPNLQLWF